MEDKKDNVDSINKIIVNLKIDEMMTKYKYFPNCTEFESLNKEIPDNNNFSKIFNNFLSRLKDFDTYLTYKISSKKNINSSYREYLIEYLMNYETEVKDYLNGIWEMQLEEVKYHTGFFIILVDKYIKISGKISEYDKNILFWTILYHDLGKYMKMNTLIDEKIDVLSYDKTHPFKSIIIFLNSVFYHNLFYYPNDEYKHELTKIYKEEFIDSIYKSWNLEERKYYYTTYYNISFKYIDIIQKFFMKIKSQEQNEWIYDISVLIIFHQSLPNNEWNMNSPLLEEKYIKIFFTKRLIELMRIIMIYDSASHSMFRGSDWIIPINNNMDKVIKLFQ